MKKLKQGDIVYVDLNPVKGVETAKKRPCLVVSNANYNKYLNTIIILPITSSMKYTQPPYVNSPLFVPLPDTSKVTGTILLQHLRTIDPQARTAMNPITTLDKKTLNQLLNALNHFFTPGPEI